MKADNILISSENSLAIVIDPLADFISEKGAFSRCYGEKDTERVRNVANDLEAMVDEWNERVRVLLCRSKYEYDQCKVRNLEMLCVTEQGRESMIAPEMFSAVIEKYENSILCSPDIEEYLSDEILHLIPTGITTTSCVRKSIRGIQEKFPHIKIIIPKNAVASRISRENDENALLDLWGKSNNVIVVKRWQDIDLDIPSGRRRA